ncbi:hypothetical protein CDAR_622841 [Caerostris darwini]|uniref:Uncharacterized protein n=1 Tax=Caerostris darwini TaxID=1538125 RepID=A0AAV4WKX7_9ARAC|nr:hypothetical protein CDAR_622841 [Caerostris darwini]
MERRHHAERRHFNFKYIHEHAELLWRKLKRLTGVLPYLLRPLHNLQKEEEKKFKGIVHPVRHGCSLLKQRFVKHSSRLIPQNMDFYIDTNDASSSFLNGLLQDGSL